MKNEDKLHKTRHSLAHLLAAAVLGKDPDAKLGIGPVIENGFYTTFKHLLLFSDSNCSELRKECGK